MTDTMHRQPITRHSGERQEHTLVLASGRSGPCTPTNAQPASDSTTLTLFLRQHVQRLMSSDADPLPPCPRCHSVHVNKKGYARLHTGPLPYYQCADCGGFFNRLSDTPLTGRPLRRQVDALIELLPQPLSCPDAARRLGVTAPALREAVRLFRRWLLELDPSGRHERCVQLGGRLTAVQDLPPVVVDSNVVYEDRLLGMTLLSDFDEIHSRHPGRPACPACSGRRIRHKGSHGDLPRYQCMTCGKQFNRRTGTPFTRNRQAARQRELIRYLGLPLPLMQLAEIIDTDVSITARLVREFRTRCDQLDPSGSLAARIQTCARPTTDTPCVWCGTRRVRFDVAGIDVGKCGNCGRLISMRRELVERNGILEAGPWQLAVQNQEETPPISQRAAASPPTERPSHKGSS
ncbi:hypothetical protein R75465_07752 [Paraburkholderia aspalathi]|uniref:DUF746 domain-containing protein n=1 Tax=Paraburkholderia aspalathi TaxID=1324617 RepID=UPI001B11A5F2|nr:DUF746 domain-containing protein [Paraburkholderia aspalathi]CAE6862693.1 hypothetical protein R75465_07752 [Paraburkholderia aspalathi]